MVIPKGRTLSKHGGEQLQTNDDNRCINPTITYENDEYDENDDYDDIENTKLNEINSLIESYIFENETGYTSLILNTKINDLDIQDLYIKIENIIDNTNQLRPDYNNITGIKKKNDVINTLKNILDLVPEPTPVS
tara:strand:- start:681 stop:1085 length:405 start_codon:yes stop_codon:yes gene_type:complete